MAINSIGTNNVNQVLPKDPPKDIEKNQPPPKQGSATAKDTVTISSQAQAALQQAKESSGQEAVETPQQTAQEARNGDRQAQQLQVRQQQAHAQYKAQSK